MRLDRLAPQLRHESKYTFRPHCQQPVLIETICLDTLASVDKTEGSSTSAKQRERIIATLDRMVEKGRLTRAEADRLRAANEPSAFDTALRSVRMRHANSKLAAAIEDGSVSQQDADAILDRLGKGEHSSAIRAHLRALLPRGRSRARRAATKSIDGQQRR